jgi:predicted nuclease of predicted toxin-antitoxin system
VKLLLNENIDPSLAERLRASGCDVTAIREILPGASDEVVLQTAVSEGRILVTHDKDFGELAFHRGLPAQCGVILFRVIVTEFDVAVEFMLQTILGGSEWSGHFSVVEARRIRRRPLAAPKVEDIKSE